MTPGPDNPEKSFPIVGIGASAGGLQPLEAFLGALPTEFGFAIVFVQHLSPRHKSLLPELLRARTSGLEIEEIANGREILPGRLYLCPPALEVRVEKGIFRVLPASGKHVREHVHLSIDEFFFSLAGDAPERAIGVIFSGAGTDGARGAQAIKTAGGTVYIQDPATAEFPAMPRAAINAGQIDGVLSPEDIARQILTFSRSGTVARPDELSTPEQFDSFYELIRERTGYRFSHYKKSVVARRIRRRMYLHGISSVDDYLGAVEKSGPEASMLASDLMIGVTSFFRDRLAWKALHLEVTRKLAAQNDDSPIRVWTPACATGEEPYSIAMLLRNELDLAGKKREIQVFATDVNDRALERAREGTYPGTISADVPPEYLRKFFTRTEDGLSATISKELRQCVVFAKQDLLTDPPFSHLDLVICRNLLIYLEPDAQEKCIGIFHYALKEGGHLFLGGAESPGRNSALFTPLAHKKCRVYKKIETQSATRMPLAIPFAAERSPAPPSKRPTAAELRQSATLLIQEVMLEEYAPAAVAINQSYDILYHNGPTHRYLHPPRGTPTQNLLELLPKSLRNRIRGGLYRTAQEAVPVSIRTSIPGEDEHSRLVFIRISKIRENLFLVVFKEKGGSAETVSLETSAIEEMAVRQLESELSATRDDLQSHIEQLKSLNEELHSSNEELQAANEELETSREELQSLNEELTTVNSQLQVKIDEQEETNNDLGNFLTSTSIPTIFLDRRLQVKRFTPAMSRLIKLIPADVGRPITHMSHENLGPDLIPDAQAVLDLLVPITKEIRINGSWHVRTTLPYRTSDERIEGVVITYTDITERKRGEEMLRRQADMLNLSYEAIFAWEFDGPIIAWNRGAEQLYGYSSEEAVGRLGHDLLRTVHPENIDGIMTILTRNGTWAGELLHTTKDGRSVTVESRHQLIKDGSGRQIVLETGRDISDRKRAEMELKNAHSDLERRVKERTAELQQAYDRLLKETKERQQLEAQLRQSHKMDALGTLTGGIAHDFNNILAAMIGFTEILLGPAPPGSREKHYLERVLEAGLRGRELIKRMLTFSRKTEQDKKPLHLGSLVKETMSLLRSSIPTSISIRMDIEKDSSPIFADPVQMQQVLVNLCTNAAFAMREKGGALDVELRDFNVSESDGGSGEMKPGSYVKLVVHDTGTGMAPDIIDKIFDPFFTTKELGEGSGLGLSVIHGIVEQHDGYITVESQMGKGTTFTVYFPRISEEPFSSTVPEEDIPTGSEHVLFVDDEDALTEMGQDLLEDLGYKVTVTTSSSKALALFKADPTRFGLVITDQTMPEMTGVELAKRILRLRPDMPVILCTGFSHTVDEESARATGIKAFVMKPLTRKEIARTIRKALEG